MADSSNSSSQRFAAQTANEKYVQCMALEQRWINVWPQCIAKAWAEPDFYDRLTHADPEETRQIFKEEFDYDILDHLNLEIRPGTGTADTCGTDDCEFVQFTEMKPVIEMTMYIPPVPADARAQARALAHHTEASQIYPFTTW